MKNESVRLSWSSPVWRRVLLLVFPVLVFSNSLRNGYHLDDFYRIVNNPHILELGNPWRFFADPNTSSSLPTIVQYRPFMPFTFALGRTIGGWLGVEAVISDHLGSLGFHLLTGFLLFGWLERVLRLAGRDAESSARVAGWATLLYAVHPVVGAPVNYLCARDLLLMQMFAVGSLNAWARYREAEVARRPDAKRWAVVALAGVACSMLSKQNAVALPLVLLCFEWMVLRAPLRELRTWRGPAAFVVVVLGFFAWTEWVVGFSDTDQLAFERVWWEYPATMAETHLFYYLRNAVWPFEMRMLPNIEVATTLLDLGVLAGAAFIVATLVVAWRERSLRPVLAFAILAYWLMFAVTSSVRPFRYLAMDYRQVPSLPYLCLLFALGIDALVRRFGRRELFVIAVAYFSLATLANNRHWRDGEALWGQAVRKGTRAQGHVNYGLAIKGKKPEEALDHFALALEEGPNVYARINRGLVLISMGRESEGIESLQLAADNSPTWGLTAYWLSRGKVMVGDLEASLAPAQRATRLEPGNARYQAHLVRVYLKLGDRKSATRALSQVDVASPELAALRRELGLAG